MKAREEKKLLKDALKRLDSNRKIIPEQPWFYPLSWVLTVLCLLAVFQLEDRGITNPTISGCLMLMIGIGVGWVSVAGTAARRWPTIGRHLNRESIERRLNELRG